MKVLLGTVSLDTEQGGGTAQRTTSLARYLTFAGAECRVATMQDGDLAWTLRADAVPVYATGYVKLRYHVPLVNFRRLDRLVREADVLHLLGYWNLLSVVLAWLARRHSRPYLLSAAGEFAALTKGGPMKQWFHRLFGLRMIAGARALVAVTELERQQMIDLLPLDPHRVFVVPNGVEPIGDDAGAGVDATLPDAPFVLFMGRLAPIKGPDLLLEAFTAAAQRFGDVALVFAGPDLNMRKQLEARSRDLGLGGRVVFTGFLGSEARQAAYRRALMLVVPSRDEAMSLVALEAGALGTPVLLTNRCGFDVVEEIGGGRVVSATVEELRDGLITMLASRDCLPEMGERLQVYVLQRYGWPVIAERLLHWLRDPSAPYPSFVP